MENEEIQVFDIANELIIIPKSVIDIFLKEKNPADLIALYNFYYYTAKWQKTNQPKCTDKFVQNGLYWGFEKFNKAKNKLIELGLIKTIKRIDAKGKITGWFIKINYIFKKENSEKIALINHSESNLSNNTNNDQNSQNPVLVKSSTGKQTTNALSTNNINALSTNNINAYKNFYSFFDFLNNDILKVYNEKDKNEFDITVDMMNKKEIYMSRICNAAKNSEFSSKSTLYILTEYLRIREKLTGQKNLKEEKQLEYLKRFFEYTQKYSYRTVILAIHKYFKNNQNQEEFKIYYGISDSKFKEYLKKAYTDVNSNAMFYTPKIYNPNKQKWIPINTGEDNIQYHERIKNDLEKKLGDI